MQKCYLIRNRTTVVVPLLKREVVEDRAVFFHQQFAPLALEILTDRDLVSLLEETLNGHIPLRQEIPVVKQTGKKYNQSFDVRFAVLVFCLPVQLLVEVAPDLTNRTSNSCSLSNIRERNISSGKMRLVSACCSSGSVGTVVTVSSATGK